MNETAISLLLFISLLVGISYLNYQAELTTDVEVYICKDNQKRVFFMGEKEDYERLLKIEAFSEESCKKIAVKINDWNNLRYRHKNRRYNLF